MRLAGGDNLIQSPTLNRRLADYLNLKESSPVPTLAPELQAVVMVADLTHADREDTQSRVSVGFEQAGAVGRFTYFQVYNPAGSNILVKPHLATISHRDVNFPQHFVIGYEGTLEVGTTGNAQIVNRRSSAVQLSTALVGSGTLAGLPATSLLFQFDLPSLCNPVQVDLEGFVLPPGLGMTFYGTVANHTDSWSLEWTEEHLQR